MSKSFGNDVLLALSCREAGLALVTDNRRDFERSAKSLQSDAQGLAQRVQDQVTSLV